MDRERYSVWLVRFRINTAMGKSEECGILPRTDGGKRASILSAIKIYSGFALKVSLMGCAVSVSGNAYSAPISCVPRSVISTMCSLIPHGQNLYCSFFRRRSRSETAGITCPLHSGFKTTWLFCLSRFRKRRFCSERMNWLRSWSWLYVSGRRNALSTPSVSEKSLGTSGERTPYMGTFAWFAARLCTQGIRPEQVAPNSKAPCPRTFA